VCTPVEFGHKVFLADSAIGLITQYEVLKGNPVDEVIRGGMPANTEDSRSNGGVRPPESTPWPRQPVIDAVGTSFLDPKITAPSGRRGLRDSDGYGIQGMSELERDTPS
jgi:hypothetical protein